MLPELSGYRILSKIGSGGIANVYAGVHDKSNQKVAIKILKSQTFKNSEASLRFLKEAKTGIELKHPNIINIFEISHIEKECYLVMEYLETSLRDRLILSKGSILSPADWDMFTQVAQGLLYAHQKGIIHRDIKPENIMFKPDGTSVLVDFGLAKIANSSEKLTKSGVSVGTPDYMSPEQIEGKPVDGRTDIYSLGIILYEMLMGEVPYKAKNYITLALKHLRKRIPRLPFRLKKYQPLLNMMMAKDREKRVQNCTELIQTLSYYRQRFNPSLNSNLSGKHNENEKKN
jgi:serine/threonine protein kinase